MADQITPPPVAAPVTQSTDVKPEVVLPPDDSALGNKFLDKFKELNAQVTAPKVAEPPKAPEAKPTDAKPADVADPLENPAGLSPKASEQFKHIKGSRDEWRTKAKTFEDERTKLLAEIDTLKKAPAAPQVDMAEIETLRKQHKELDEQLRLTAIERHPKFKAHFDSRMNEANQLASESVGKEHATKLAAILKMPDGETRNEQLEALSANLTPLQQGRLAAALVEVQKVERERSSELAKATAEYDKVVAHEKAQTEKQTGEQRAKSEARLKSSLALAATVPAFKPAEGDTEGATKAAEYEQLVRAFHAGKLPEDMQAAIPVMAITALHQKTVQIPALQAEIEKLNGIIASYTKASPSAAGGSAKATEAAALPDDGNRFINVFKQNNPTTRK